MIGASAVTGLVLAGGRGSRMGGVDKGLQHFRGTPLALNALTRLQRQEGGLIGPLMVNANRNLALYEAFGHPVWPDTLADYAGPLAGFMTGLAHCETPWLLTVPCDTPLFPMDLAQRLASAFDDQQTEIAMVAAREEDGPLRNQPVFCLLRAEPDGQPGGVHPGRRAQDRPLDRPAPHRGGSVRPSWRRPPSLFQRQHPGRTAVAGRRLSSFPFPFFHVHHRADCRRAARLRPAGADRRQRQPVPRPPRVPGLRQRNGRGVRRARPGAGRGRDVADQRTAARQLRDGRLRLRWRVTGRGSAARAAAGRGHRLRRQGLGGNGRRGRMREDHDRRDHAGRHRHRGAA